MGKGVLVIKNSFQSTRVKFVICLDINIITKLPGTRYIYLFIPNPQTYIRNISQTNKQTKKQNNATQQTKSNDMKRKKNKKQKKRICIQQVHK